MEKQIISKIKRIILKTGLSNTEKLEQILGIVEPFSDVRWSVYALGVKLADYFVTQSVFSSRDMSKKITCCLDDIIFAADKPKQKYITPSFLFERLLPIMEAEIDLPGRGGRVECDEPAAGEKPRGHNFRQDKILPAWKEFCRWVSDNIDYEKGYQCLDVKEVIHNLTKGD